nr:MAG TPA: hypothetical protein [Caudoviricetes sp.]
MQANSPPMCAIWFPSNSPAASNRGCGTPDCRFPPR